CHVVSLLATRQAAAEHQVVDLVRIELRDLGQGGTDHLDGQVVGTDVLERPLEGATDRRTRGGDDDCLGHVALLGSSSAPRGRLPPSRVHATSQGRKNRTLYGWPKVSRTCPECRWCRPSRRAARPSR